MKSASVSLSNRRATGERRHNDEQVFELGANLDVGGVQLLLHHLLQNSQGGFDGILQCHGLV